MFRYNVSRLTSVLPKKPSLENSTSNYADEFQGLQHEKNTTKKKSIGDKIETLLT